jgi:SAM-dependent methyltransferase
MNTPETRVLIVGALDVNGSVKPYFDKSTVIGIDLTDGPGVDHVINAHYLLEPDSLELIGNTEFDVVACTEMLEHDDEFWRSLYNISVLLRPGGYLILTARGARRGIEGKQHGESMWEHAYPDDYYRFMPNAVPKLLDLAGCDVVEDLQDPYYPGFLALGRRR